MRGARKSVSIISYCKVLGKTGICGKLEKRDMPPCHLPSEGRGHRFESCRARQLFQGLRQGKRWRCGVLASVADLTESAVFGLPVSNVPDATWGPSVKDTTLADS